MNKNRNIKTREEVRDILYEIADGIKANADKYSDGHNLVNEDWVGLSTKLGSIMDYLGNSSIEPSELYYRN